MTYLSRLFEEQNMNENRFYVYLHKIKETGEIFYVGKGTGDRFSKKHRRSKRWHKIAESNEWTSEIFLENLSEDDALELEEQLINKFNPAANILKKISKRIKINAEYVNKMYKYDENSPSGLVHLLGNSSYGPSKRNAGDIAGTLRKDNNYYIVPNGKHDRGIYAHRVVWFLCKGEDPGDFLIDHIDGNPSNNRIENLRKVTASQNSRNCKAKSNNKFGIRGIACVGDKAYSVKWVGNSGNRESRHFSFNKYGKDVAFVLACLCRMISNYAHGYDSRDDALANVDFSLLSKYKNSELLEMLRFDNSVHFEQLNVLIPIRSQ